MEAKNDLLQKIRTVVHSKFPDAKLILYGSRAKGNARPDSDWDILVLLNEDKITPDIEESVTYPLYDLEYELGEVISPMVYSLSDWNSKYHVTSFYKNVMSEGVKI